MAPDLNPIIIVGCRRSGTTLLRAMLDKHPDLLVHPQEPQFILELHRRFGLKIADVEAAIQFVTTHRYRAENVTPVRLGEALGNSSPRTLREFAQAYLHVWGGEMLVARRPVFKHPMLIFHLDLVFNLFPAAKIIHIVRDPRGNVASQRARWPKAAVWECLTWWRNAVRIGHALAQNQPDRCLEVRYEDLVLAPESTLQPICRFMDVPFAGQMLNFEMKTQAFTPRSAAEEKTYLRVDLSRLEIWRNSLSAGDIAMIERACSSEMAWWGYAPTQPATAFLPLAGRALYESSITAMLKTGRALRDAMRDVLRAHLPRR